MGYCSPFQTETAQYNNPLLITSALEKYKAVGVVTEVFLAAKGDVM